MQPYSRAFPLFSLCGLNCGLCPQHQTQAASRCPGCGGADFHLQHPTCPIITCSRRHGDVAFCFECVEYPCERYAGGHAKDSFISYLHVGSDMRRAQQDGMEAYMAGLNEKVVLLEDLLARYDDGRSKRFFCNAVNLLPIEAVRRVSQAMHAAEAAGGGDEAPEETVGSARRKTAAAEVRALCEAEAMLLGISLVLRR